MAGKRIAVVVPERWDGATVKEVARGLLQLSSTRLKKAKRLPDGIVLGGRGVTVVERVRAGEELSIALEDPAALTEVEPVPGALDVVYEDEYLLVLNKPAGLPVHPSPGHARDTLANRAVARYGEAFRPVNRLDAGTSGLMAAARDPHVHARLSRALHTPDFFRAYLAVTEGPWEQRAGTIDLPIARAPGSAIRRCVDPAGQRAVTHFRVLTNRGGVSLVELVLETGRTHQIRVHLSHLGHPLIGDFLYGKEEPERIARPALHAWKLHFVHPMSGEELRFCAPLPEDMRALLRK